MKRAILFDLYGTLIDINTDEHDPFVYSTLSSYLSYHSVKISPEELKQSYFQGIKKYMALSEETYPEVDIFKVFSYILNTYGSRRYTRRIILDTILLFRSLTIRHFEVFPNLYDFLNKLVKKYKTAIVSDAQWTFTENEIAKLDLERFFNCRILSSRYGFKKPDSRLFNIALEKLKVLPEESVYIGDNSVKDLIGAKRSGMKCILFRSECKSYNEFEPDACFDDYSQLPEILKELSH